MPVDPNEIIVKYTVNNAKSHAAARSIKEWNRRGVLAVPVPTFRFKTEGVCFRLVRASLKDIRRGDVFIVERDDLPCVATSDGFVPVKTARGKTVMTIERKIME
jgi:hypothetical protein